MIVRFNTRSLCSRVFGEKKEKDTDSGRSKEDEERGPFLTHLRSQLFLPDRVSLFL